jgi:two-component system, OmpR family, sensor histidine kinase ChvG
MRGQEGMMAWLRAHWPRLRLRTILFGIFVFVAGLPGLGAVFLRVYENTLVRQTESELITQGAALVAATGGRFAGANKPPATISARRDYGDVDTGYYKPEPPKIDLSQSEIEPERPDPEMASAQPNPASLALAQRMQPIIEQTGRTTLASIILLDAQGTILTGSWAGRSYARLPEIAAALAGHSVTKLRYNGDYQARYAFEWLTRAAAVRVHHARPITVDGKVMGVLLLCRSSRALFRGIYEDRGKIGLGVFLILITLGGLTFLLHRTIARPIEALSLATRDVSAGRGAIPPPPSTAATEIRALYLDFADMAEVIARRSRYLRDFAAAVAHEFKTPLAGIRGGIELIEDHHGSMSAAERKRFLGNISADADRLSALVSRLLDLARADMARPEAGASTALGQTLPPIVDAVRSEKFQITLDLDAQDRVALPEATIERVVMGLLDNARQAGASAVWMTSLAQTGHILLTLSDNGPGVAAADRARLFEPFFTTRRSEGGTGLGLSIARSLLEASHASLDLGDADNAGNGAAFVLTLPIAQG